MPALRIVLVVALVAVSLTEVAENFLDLFLTILLLQLEAGSKFETSKYFRLKLKSFILPNTRGEREWGHNFEPLILDIIGTDRALIQTLPKAQRTRGLSPSCQSNFLKSHQKFKHKS